MKARIKTCLTQHVATFLLPRPIEFAELEQIFVRVAPSVFAHFEQNAALTTYSQQIFTLPQLDQHNCQQHKFVNGELVVTIENESYFHDNSLTAEWLYIISLHIQNQIDFFELGTRLTAPTAPKLFYKFTPAYAAFAKHWLAILQTQM